MNLTLVGIGDFNATGLYCLDDSPLQNQELFPGCYGICANPDVSGIGNRISLYIQTILTLWLATLTPHPDDTLGAMLAAIAASFTVFVATLAQYAYNNITFHHTLITINLSNLPTVAFFAGILRLRLQPGIIPLGPKLFATPILILQFIACGVSVFLGVGLNAQVGNSGGANSGNSGRGGEGGWEVAQPQCNNETQVVIFGRSLQFWQTESVENLNDITQAQRIVILVVYGIIVFLPFLSSFICLYLPETGTLRVFATAFHQEKRTNKFALISFFILSNAWTGILIYATEVQIMRNRVLPGEAIWGAGQILAMFLVLIPLLGCIKIFIKEVGDRNTPARRWFKRVKMHKLFGVRFEPHGAGLPNAPSAPDTPRHSQSREPSHAGSIYETKDVESGLRSPAKGSTPTSPRPKSPMSAADQAASRRLSKRGRFEVPKPGDNPIVSPGEDHFDLDEIERSKGDYFGKRPGLSDTRQTTNTLVDNEKRKDKRKSLGSSSIASQSARSLTGNVKVIVKPDGRMSRVISRRSSYVGGNESESGRRNDRDDAQDGKPRRRLSKPRPESSSRVSSSRRSEDGYHSAAEDISRTSSRRASKSGRYDQETIRGRSGYDAEDKDKNDDPLSKYYWDAQRGWLERK